MFLIATAHEILEATSAPAREEDPFSVMARTTFERICSEILPARPGARLAIALANCYGGWTFCDPQIKRLVEDGPGRVSAYLSVAWFPAAAQGRITIQNQLKVPALTLSTEFYAFYDAMRVCRSWLKQGVCDIALCRSGRDRRQPVLVVRVRSRATQRRGRLVRVRQRGRGARAHRRGAAAGSPRSLR